MSSFQQQSWFDAVWDDLSRFGRCDERGGIEYRRVLALWAEAGRPAHVEGFILMYANLDWSECPYDMTGE
jgi:hypothetical protein